MNARDRARPRGPSQPKPRAGNALTAEPGLVFTFCGLAQIEPKSVDDILRNYAHNALALALLADDDHRLQSVFTIQE